VTLLEDIVTLADRPSGPSVKEAQAYEERARALLARVNAPKGEG
jgi:hypothetical protein